MKLASGRLNYHVLHKSKAIGSRKASTIWLYGAELINLDNNGVSKKVFFLCKKCHINHTPNCLYDIRSGTAHVVNHLAKVHNINPGTGLMPPAIGMLSDPFQTAAATPGAQLGVAHSPWQEVELLKAYVDWAILHVLSFWVVTAADTRGL
ncbi:hypothetical protein PSPO01_12478 [Paraphaeosphaeria sporulosa]